MVWEQGMVQCGGQRNRLTPRNWVPEAAAPSSEGPADPVSHKGGWGQTQVAAPSPSQSELDLSCQLSPQGPAPATRRPFWREGESRREARILGFGKAGPFHLPSEAQKWSCECELTPQRALARVRGTETLGLGCSGWVLALRLGRTS